MNCLKCKSLKTSMVIYSSKEVTRCWACGFVVAKKVDLSDHPEVVVKPKQKRATKANKLRCLVKNPPNAIDHWLWSQGTTAMNGADAVDAMEARSRSDEF